MQTLLQVLEKTSDFFARKGLEQPRLQAELLFAHALGCKRLELFLKFDQPLTEAKLNELRLMVRRRANREPLQYIIGYTPFHDLKLKTDRRALIPRPETEQLVEIVQDRLREKPPTRILDLGTGSGAIALALAAAFPDASVTATDISEDALSLARENALANELQHRVQFIESNWFSNVKGSFDCIVSNPPYLSTEEVNVAEPEVRDFEPRNALVAADEGMADLKSIIDGAYRRLQSDGLLALETGIKQHDALTAFARSTGFAKSESLKDLHNRHRFFLCWK